MTRRSLLAAALTLLILFPTLLFVHAQAQTNSEINVEFYGAVQSANANALVINGQLIDISGAQVNAALVAGTVVRVQASMTADGSLIATQVDPVAPGLIPGLVEIEGGITEVSDTTLRIGSQTFDISGAQVAASLAVGQMVHVYAVSDGAGTWSARLITADIAPVQTPEVGAPVATAEISPVQTPEVIAPASTPEVQPPGSTPEVIAPASTPEVEDGENFDIRGRLDGFTDAEVIVDGRRYFIGGAKIDGRLVPGAPVRLEIRVVNGQWVLEEIKVEDSGSSDDRGGNSGSGGSGGSDDDNRGSNSGSGSSGSGSGNSGSGGGNSGSGSSGGGNSGSGGGNSGSGGGNSGSGGGGSSGHGGGDDD